MPGGVLLLLPLLLAQVPERDSRLSNLPNTDTHFTMPEYKTRADWEKRKLHLRQQILTSAGLDPMPVKNPLNARITGRIRTKDCTIEKVLIETMPGYFLGGNQYRPLTGAGKHPAVFEPARALGLWTPGESAVVLWSATGREPGAAGLCGVRVGHGRVQRHRADTPFVLAVRQNNYGHSGRWACSCGMRFGPWISSLFLMTWTRPKLR